MKIEKIVVGFLEENCYVVSDENKNALIIDPGDEFLRIKEVADNYYVKGILITHYHFDHIGAMDELEKCYQVQANDFESLKDFKIDVFETPGHTNDSLSFYFPKDNILFSGDFVFKGAIGRTDLGGNDNDMEKSLAFLLHHFSGDMKILPGHGDATTINNEKSSLKFFQ